MPLAVNAASLPEPKVDYSADSTMEPEGGITMKSHTYYSPGKQRMEMGGANGNVTIIRRDKKVMWQLMENIYMEMSMDQLESSDLDSKAKQEEMGRAMGKTGENVKGAFTQKNEAEQKKFNDKKADLEKELGF